MFFLRKLTRELTLEPKDFGRDIKYLVRERLKEAVEGVSLGREGYVIAVPDVEEKGISRGRLASSVFAQQGERCR